MHCREGSETERKNRRPRRASAPRCASGTALLRTSVGRKGGAFLARVLEPARRPSPAARRSAAGRRLHQNCVCAHCLPKVTPLFERGKRIVPGRISSRRHRSKLALRNSAHKRNSGARASRPFAEPPPTALPRRTSRGDRRPATKSKAGRLFASGLVFRGASDRIRTCNPQFTKLLRYRCATLARAMRACVLYDIDGGS